MTSPSHQKPQKSGLIFGIDGGGARTVAWLATASAPAEVLGRGFSGPSNQRAVGPKVAMAHLNEAVQAAFDDAGIDRQTVDAACLGLAGAERPSDQDVIKQWAEEARLTLKLRVVTDVLPLLYVGGSDGSGVVLIAGTSSMAWGRNDHNETARSGGWGYLFGDEGSEFAIGRAILQAVAWSIDGRGPTTGLIDDVCQKLGISSATEIVGAVYSNEIPRAVIAGLAPLAFDAAERLDVISCDIITTAARELAALVISVARRLRLQDQLALFFAGTLPREREKFCHMIVDAISSHSVRVVATHVVAEPAEGALALARQIAVS